MHALSVMAAGSLAAGTGVVLAGGTAGADTTQYTSSCAGTPLGTISSGVVTTGSLPPRVRQKFRNAFKLGTSGIDLIITNSTILSALAGNTLGGTVTTSLAGSNTNPPTQPITYTIPSTPVPAGATSLTLVGVGSPTAWRAPAKGAVSISTTASAQIAFKLGAVSLPAFTCTSSPAPLVIASTTANRMP